MSPADARRLADEREALEAYSKAYWERERLRSGARRTAAQKRLAADDFLLAVAEILRKNPELTKRAAIDRYRASHPISSAKVSTASMARRLRKRQSGR
jgi:hypothetical protein